MSESNPMLQLSLAPSAPEPETAPGSAESIQQAPAAAEPETAPKLDESQLTEAEKKAIEDFIKKVDVTNPDHVLLFGADAQKRIADFSQTALDAVKTQETGEVGNMLVNLVSELKGFQKDSEDRKGLARLFAKGEDKITRMKARYSKVSANVDSIAGSLEGYQTQLLKDVAMFDRLYDQNSDYFHQLTLYIIAGDKKLVRTISMDYQRRQFKVDTGKSISCISIDEGVIHHMDGHLVPICELEIEWYYGDEDDFMQLAELIQDKYELVAEDRSKLQRAFE